VKLLLREEGSEDAVVLWNEADWIASSRVLYAEARATLAAAKRARRVRGPALTRLRERLDLRIDEIDMVELSPAIASVAGDCAEGYSLRSNDAIHLASALSSAVAGQVFVSWDAALRKAAAQAGLAVAPS
jgi:uncharacterized protein